jgi:hypothetical protein
MLVHIRQDYAMGLVSSVRQNATFFSASPLFTAAVPLPVRKSNATHYYNPIFVVYAR